MALIWTRQKSRTTDFLGTNDEPYTFHGDADRRLAEKFFEDISRHQKQLLFIYGEQGVGKSRLAKQTARKLAETVNRDNPLLSLFMINCQRFGKEGPERSDLQKEIAQKVAAVDEDLSQNLARCKSHEFSPRLASSLVDRMFLFLFDGIISNFKTVVSFMDDIVEHNNNVIIVASSAEYLSMAKQKSKVSTHSCSGLPPADAVALLREVAGPNLADELLEYQDEIVGLCHFNPFLIMRVGQQMSDEIFSYTPVEMRELLQESVMLAVSGVNVPEREDIFARELALTQQLTKDMGRNIGLVLDISQGQFTAGDVRGEMGDGKVKKCLLESLTYSSVLSQENGYYSLSSFFQDFCVEQAANINAHMDDVVVEVYRELKETLGSFVSQRGLQKVFMVHSNEMRQIREFERMIPRGGHENGALRFINRGHFINACSSFLSNIPLGAQAVSLFKEKSFAHLYRIDRQEKALQAPREPADALYRQLMDLNVNNQNSAAGRSGDRSEPVRGRSRVQNGRRGESAEQNRVRRDPADVYREEDNYGQRQNCGESRNCQRIERGGKYQGVGAFERHLQRKPSGSSGQIGDEGDRSHDNHQGKPKLVSDINGVRRMERSEYQKGRSGTENRRDYPQATVAHRPEDQGMFQGGEIEPPFEFREAHDDPSLGKGSNTTEPSDVSMIDRFGQVGAHRHLVSRFSDVSSIKTSGELESSWGSLATGNAPDVGNMPTRLDFRAMLPKPPPVGPYHPPSSRKLPVESSDPTATSPPRWVTTGPSQQSFHEWPEEGEPGNGAPLGEWSMENNPPSPSQERHAPP